MTVLPEDAPRASLAVSAADGGTIELRWGDEVVLARSSLVDVVVNHDAIARISDAHQESPTSVHGYLQGTRVHAKWAARRLGGTTAWELSLQLRNDGDEAVEVRRMDPLAATLQRGVWNSLAFRSSWCEEYRPERADTSTAIRLESRSGRSSHGVSPWLGLEQAGRGFVVSPAWSGNWHIDVARGRISAGISDWLLAVDLAPGEEVAAPSVIVAVGDDIDDAARAMARAVGLDWMPRSPASDRMDIEWNSWLAYEDAGIDEQVARENAVIAAECGLDTAVVDAGWFGPEGDTYWYFQRGDWTAINEGRFPGGLRALGEGMRASGMRAGIWLEPEGVGRHAALRRDHPELLACTVEQRAHDRSYERAELSLAPDDPAFLGYVCLGSAEAREFVLDAMCDTVAQTGAEWLKIDFNVDPDAGCTRTDHGHGAGDGLYRHVLGLYDVLDRFRARHPEVLVEACASGGMRIDLGLARHVDCFFLSDADYTENHLQVMWGASHMLPPRALFHWSWSGTISPEPPEQQADVLSFSDEEFATTLRATMLHRWGVSLRLPELPDRLRAVLARHTRIYRETVAEMLLDGELHRLSGQPLRRSQGERSPSFQLARGDRSLVLVTRLDAGAPQEAVTPRGLDSKADYRVTELDADTEPFIISGDGALPTSTSSGRMASRLFLIEPA